MAVAQTRALRGLTQRLTEFPDRQNLLVFHQTMAAAVRDRRSEPIPALPADGCSSWKRCACRCWSCANNWRLIASGFPVRTVSALSHSIAGCFRVLGTTPEMVAACGQEHAIYMVGDSRPEHCGAEQATVRSLPRRSIRQLAFDQGWGGGHPALLPLPRLVAGTLKSISARCAPWPASVRLLSIFAEDRR